MDYYSIDMLADRGEGGYCFTDRLPDGIGLQTYKLSGGIPIAKDYPENPFDVELHLGEDYPGLALPSFIGNTGRLLVFHKDAAETVRKFDIAETEILPFSLYDHKNRVYSKDYVFLNPLRIVDCVHHNLSEIKYTKKGKLLKINKLVLDEKKLKDAPDLFRLEDKPNVCLFSASVVDALQAGGFTNFHFGKIDRA